MVRVFSSNPETNYHDWTPELERGDVDLVRDVMGAISKALWYRRQSDQTTYVTYDDFDRRKHLHIETADTGQAPLEVYTNPLKYENFDVKP